ncbi:hypothetical protein MDAP_001890 [Mitosporidium daphniae]
MSKEDNRLGRHMVKAYNSALDDVEKCIKQDSVAKSSALITIGLGKFYSNGLNLPEFFDESSTSKQEAIIKLIEFLDLEFLPLLGRILIFPIPTVALINGHCYAGGLLLALSHDYRIGQSKNGYYCMNEIKIGLPMHPSMMALLHAKVCRDKITRDALLTAKRWNADQALKDELIDLIVDHPDTLMAEGKEFAKKIMEYQYGGPNYSSLKETMYSKAFKKLSQGKNSKFSVKL